MDVRFQFTLDKVRVLESEEEKNEPDIKLSIIFGNLFSHW